MFVFNRDYVSKNRTNYVSGQTLPEYAFTQEQINRLIDAGIVLRVENHSTFIENIDSGVEKLNPEPRRKK